MLIVNAAERVSSTQHVLNIPLEFLGVKAQYLEIRLAQVVLRQHEVGASPGQAGLAKQVFDHCGQSFWRGRVAEVHKVAAATEPCKRIENARQSMRAGSFQRSRETVAADQTLTGPA
jgi:hypothetical protein